MRDYIKGVRDGSTSERISLTRFPWTAAIVIATMFGCAAKEAWICDEYLDRDIYGDEVLDAAQAFLKRNPDAKINVVLRDFERSGYPLDRFMALGPRVVVRGVSTKAWEKMNRTCSGFFVGDDDSSWVVHDSRNRYTASYTFREQRLARGLRYLAQTLSTMPG